MAASQGLQGRRGSCTVSEFSWGAWGRTDRPETPQSLIAPSQNQFSWAILRGAAEAPSGLSMKRVDVCG